ncbi:peptidoglycan DD-metalloendopeptidase family protein [Paenactinomyces guangxiensis]|uniref:Peptidoglycan DD-metalloendopeptidase family protein n=2 Tax=Paenactinomyces guangxiensis TaxID=1490290 RepID=A0A7W2A947_9BACL|nr:peptidoglycan DD-metalloendopeptidase family protein [Paenactinomyces guangxiensis]
MVFALFFTLLPVRFSSAEPDSSGIEQKKKEIKQRDKEILQLEKKKQLAEQDQKDALAHIEEMESRLNTFDKKVYELEQKIEKGQQELNRLEQQMSKRKEIFNNRLRTIYVKGDNFYLETLLKSSSFGDFVARLDLITIVTRADRQLMDGYQEDLGKVARAQEELKADLARLEQQKANANKIYEDLQAQLKQYQSKVASIDTSLNELEAENEKARKEVADLVEKATREARERERQKELAGGTIPSYTGGKFNWPVDGGTVTSPFGRRYHPIKKTYRTHEGIDIGAALGTPIKAAASGEVIESRPSNGYGYIIVIYHGDGLSTLYAHMYAQTVKVKKGQTVAPGQVIAAVGSNGQSTGPHLHFEVQKNSTPVDPMPYFR